MFTGIVEEIGTIESITKGAKSSRLRVKADVALEGTRVGDSICTNGVCLTVTRLDSTSFFADVMAETIRRSNLGSLNSGSRVNLERAVRLDGRLGGHLVSGHIDGTGTIRAMTKEDHAVWLTISADQKLLRYIVEKGSIAIDGVSLTVAGTGDSEFHVSLIPHTGKETVLLSRRVGDTVNLECDMIGKYVEKMLGMAGAQSNTAYGDSKLSEDFLMQNGFMN